MSALFANARRVTIGEKERDTHDICQRYLHRAPAACSTDLQQIVYDRLEGLHIPYQRVEIDVLAQEWYGCSDGTTTGYMKVRTADIFHKLLPSSGVIAEAVSV